MLGEDSYTYPGSGGVLRNTLNIEDSDVLDDAENAFVSVAWAAYGTETPDVFDFDYLRTVHRRMFEPLYDWAGDLRTVHVIASGTDLVYCPYEQIHDQAEKLFDELQAQDYLRGLDDWGFVSGLAEHWRKLTYVHPFRDGNTRSQVFYVSRLAVFAGHPIDWEKVSSESLRINRIAAAKGFPSNLADYLIDRLLTSDDLRGSV